MPLRETKRTVSEISKSAVATQLSNVFCNLLAAALSLILVILSADIVVQEFKNISSDLSSAIAVIPIFIYISCLLILVQLLRKRSEHSFRILIAFVIVLLGVFARGLWIVFFDSYQISDFNSYYNCGQSIANGRDFFCSQPLIWKRSLVYTAPIAYLFGNSLSALEWTNLLLFLIVALVFFILGRKVYGSAPTIIGLFVFSFYPDYWYPITLASHDNTGIFWLSLFFLFFFSAHQRLEHIEFDFYFLLGCLLI